MSGTFDVVMIGGGNMGAALLGGMIDSGRFAPSSLAVVERLGTRRDHLESLFSDIAVLGQVPPCSGAVIAVKPDGVVEATRDAVAAGATRVVSIAAGVTLATLVDAAGPGTSVIRAMPNTPALVGKGCAAIAGASGTSDADMAWAEEILGAVGIVERLDEPMLDAFTGVAGSGPAYVFLFAETLAAAAVEQGFAPEMAERVVTQLLVGSAALLERDGDPERLRINVTSPGGTTAAGLDRFLHHDLAGVVADVVDAATHRSRELG